VLYVYHQARKAPLICCQAARNICLNQACWPCPNLLTLALSAGCQAARNICCGEDAAGLARKQSAVVARVPYLPVSPCNRVRVGGFGLRVTRLSTPPCPRLPQVPQVVTAAMRAHRQAAGVQERAAVLLL